LGGETNPSFEITTAIMTARICKPKFVPYFPSFDCFYSFRIVTLPLRLLLSWLVYLPPSSQTQTFKKKVFNIVAHPFLVFLGLGSTIILLFFMLSFSLLLTLT